MSDSDGKKPTEESGQVPPAEPQDGTPTDGEQTFSAEYVKQLRGENAQRRIEAKELREQLAGVTQLIQEKLGVEKVDGTDALKAALEKMSGLSGKVDEMADKLTEQDAQIQQGAIQRAIISEAAKAGFVDPEEAVQLADLSKVTIDDDDSVTGADEVVAALVAAKPHLLKDTKTTPQIGATNPAGPGGSTSSVLGAVQRRLGGAKPVGEDVFGGGGVVANIPDGE